MDVITLSSDEEFEIPAKKPKFEETETIESKTVSKETEVNNSSVREESKDKENDKSILNGIANKANSTIVTIDESEEDVAEKVICTNNGNSKISSGSDSECLLDKSVKHNKLNQNVDKVEETLEKAIDFNEEQASTSSDLQYALDEFLEMCRDSVKQSKFEERLLSKFEKLQKSFKTSYLDLKRDASFKNLLTQNTELAKLSAASAVISFKNVYRYILDTLADDIGELDVKTQEKLRKLRKTCDRLRRAIKKLEEKEVDFEDEDQSTYIQLDAHCQKLSKVYKKYCEILKRNPNSGRIMHERIKFNSSKYREINIALTHAYRNNQFPTYYEVQKCIKKCVTKHNLQLSDSEIKNESEFCFKKMGNLLQLRRKEELLDFHNSFTLNYEDPAKTDENLRQKLKQNAESGNKNMAEVFEKYSRKQDGHEEVVLSADSDDSNAEESSDTDE